MAGKAGRSGRKTVLTEDVLQRLADAIRIGATYKHACQYAGISETTLYAWKSGKFPRGTDKALKKKFSETLEYAEGQAVTQLLAVVQSAAKAGDWRAAMTILERRYPESYGKHTHTQHSTAEDKPMEVAVDHTANIDTEAVLKQLDPAGFRLLNQLIDHIAEQEDDDDEEQAAS